MASLLLDRPYVWYLEKAVKKHRSKYYKFKLAISECLVRGAAEPASLLSDERVHIKRDERSAKRVHAHVRQDGISHLSC